VLNYRIVSEYKTQAFTSVIFFKFFHSLVAARLRKFSLDFVFNISSLRGKQSSFKRAILAQKFSGGRALPLSFQPHTVITICTDCTHSFQELCVNGISCHNVLFNLVLLRLSGVCNPRAFRGTPLGITCCILLWALAPIRDTRNLYETIKDISVFRLGCGT